MIGKIFILHSYPCALLRSLRIVDRNGKMHTLGTEDSRGYEINLYSPNMDYHYELEKKEVR